ncbi:hypothetical protein ACS3YM_06105 [Nocardia sp. N13]|uniref:hypothetical protein n=1 Tax=Nocardioides sp. N13(2025) TaxID=3453405 RepID=UPI003F7596A6
MRKPRMITGGVAALSAVAALGLGVAAQGAPQAPESRADSDVSGRLLPLNSSGASGKASVSFTSRRAGVVHVKADGLAPNLPHAQHIHFGRTARNECPTAFDAGHDHQLTTTDGADAYGPVRTSLTTSGDTSPDSVLAVDRYPVAPEGRVRYERKITFSSKALATAIRNGKGVVVIHGVDYNGNGAYDFSSGKSDLDKSLPAEATDPAVCGVLR